MDQESWRQERRHENLRTWNIDTAVGEQLIEAFAALAVHATAADASASAGGFDALLLGPVADAATVKRDFELLAGVPDSFADDRDEQGINLFRLYTYKGGQYSRQLFQLSTEVRHALIVLAERLPKPAPTCGDVLRYAEDARLPD